MNSPITLAGKRWRKLSCPVAFVPPLNLTPRPFTFVSFTCAQLDSSTNCDVMPAPSSSIFFQNGTTGPPIAGFGAVIQFDASNDFGFSFYFADGAFTTPGTYQAATPGGFPFNPGTLIVSSVPEPGTWPLVATGVLCGFWVVQVRRRRTKTC
jgi:hypothetical protein